MYRTITGERLANDENGTESYRFPNLQATLSETALDPESRNGFRASFEADTTAPAFSSLFGTGQANASDIQAPAEMYEAQIDEIRAQAYANGFAEGCRTGGEEQKKILRDALESLQKAILEIDSYKACLCQDAEREAVELSLVIARKIICREASIDRDQILRVLREALKKVKDQRELHVKMHPSDLQTVKEAELDMLCVNDGNGHVFLESEETLHRGECVIETEFGIIDARMERQLQVVEESLRAILPEGTPEQ